MKINLKHKLVITYKNNIRYNNLTPMYIEIFLLNLYLKKLLYIE